MKAIYNIRVRKENVNEILKLECVRNVEQFPDGRIIVYLKQEFTDGKTEVNKDEYIVRWENGKYQRYGATAFMNLYKNPNKEAGKQWLE